MTKNKWKAVSITTTCITGWLFCFLGMNIFREYALGLFIWLPLVMGFMNTLIYQSKFQFTGYKEITGFIFLTLGIFYLGLLLFAMEGFICMIMAAPIGFVFFTAGHLLARLVQKSKKGQQNISAVIIFIVISVPVFMAFDTLNKKDQIRSVNTHIEINASPETVWKNVIAFPQLKEPEEFIFKTGIAYPINATIDGRGIGARRHCNFSTGSFVEPITQWNEPDLLRFSVTEQPVPMQELSPYNIQPNHLHGYWVSKQGQFKLTKLSNGHTLLEGTTWYVNKIKPDFYWTLWSDYIVHKIHERVLEHIKENAELSNSIQTK